MVTSLTPAQAAAQDVLERLQSGSFLPTPSNEKRFQIIAVDATGYTIETDSQNSRLTIGRRNIEDTYLHLQAHGASAADPMTIGSNTQWASASPLCRVARGGPNRPRVVTYILPVLAAFGYVDIGAGSPNTVWLRHS